MTWNYRVVRTVTEDVVEYSVHEVYYDENDVPDGVTENPSWPAGETWEEFQADLNSYNMAMLQPVLEYDYFLELESRGGTQKASDLPAK